MIQPPPLSEKRKAQLRAARLRFHAKFPERNKEAKARYALKYPEKYKEATAKRNREQYEKNTERILQQNKEWRLANKEYVRYKNALRRQRFKMSTPLWEEELTLLVTQEAHRLRKIRENLFGFKWHVDHIVPLGGKIVSGLHVWNNLQVIPAKLNLQKHNTFKETSAWQ